MSPGPYRTPAVNSTKRPVRESLPDADILILLAIVSPAFLAVVIRTLMRGETFGAGPTVCGAIVVLAVLMAASAWRVRRRTGRLP